MIVTGQNMSKLTWLLWPLEAQLLWFLMHLQCCQCSPQLPIFSFSGFVLRPVGQKITCTDCGNWSTRLVPENVNWELKSTSEKCVGCRWAEGPSAPAVSGSGSVRYEPQSNFYSTYSAPFFKTQQRGWRALLLKLFQKYMQFSPCQLTSHRAETGAWGLCSVLCCQPAEIGSCLPSRGLSCPRASERGTVNGNLLREEVVFREWVFFFFFKVFLASPEWEASK